MPFSAPSVGVFLVLLLCCVGTCACACVEASTTDANTEVGANTWGVTMGNTFIAGCDGQIESLTLALSQAPVSLTMRVEILSTAGWTATPTPPGDILTSVDVSVPAIVYDPSILLRFIVPFPEGNRAIVEAGKTYTFRLLVTAPTGAFVSFGGSHDDIYPNGVGHSAGHIGVPASGPSVVVGREFIFIINIVDVLPPNFVQPTALVGEAISSSVAASGGTRWGSDVAVWDKFAVSTTFASSDHASLMKRNQQGQWSFFKSIQGLFTWSTMDGDYLALGGIQNTVHIFFKDQGGIDNWGEQAVLDIESPATSLSLVGDLLAVGRNDEVRIYRRVGGTQWALSQTLKGFTGDVQAHLTHTGYLGIGDPAANAATGTCVGYAPGPTGQFTNVVQVAVTGSAKGDRYGYRVTGFENQIFCSPFAAKPSFVLNVDSKQTNPVENSGTTQEETIVVLAGVVLIARPNQDSTIGDIFGRFSAATQEINAPPPGNVGSRFGHSISVDHSQIIVGAPGSDATGENSGAVYIFALTGVGFNTHPSVFSGEVDARTLAPGEIFPIDVFEQGTEDLSVFAVSIIPDAEGYSHFVLDNPQDLPLVIQHGSDVEKALNFRFLPKRPGTVLNIVTIATNDPVRRFVSFLLKATLASTAPRRTIDPNDPSQVRVEWDFDQDGVFGEVGEQARNGDEIGQDAKYVTELPANTVEQTIHFRLVRTDTGQVYSTQTTTITVRGYRDPRSTARVSQCTTQNSPTKGNTLFLGNPYSPSCCSGRAYDNAMMLRIPTQQVPIPVTSIMYRDAPYLVDLNHDVALEISGWIQSERMMKRPDTIPTQENAATLSFFLTPTKPTSPTTPTNNVGGIQSIAGAVGIVFSWEDQQTVKVRFANQNGFVAIGETPASTNIRFWDRLRHLIVIRFETAPTNYLEKATSLWVDGLLIGRFNFDLIAQLGGTQQQYTLYGGWVGNQGDQIAQTISVTYDYDACKFST